MGQVVDARGAAYLTDAEFWAPIEACVYPYYYAWYRVKDISRRLALRDQSFVVSWCHTLGDKLNSLDPFLAYLRTKKLDPSRTLDALGSVIDRGPTGYREVQDDPDAWDQAWIVDSSWASLDVGAKALEIQMGERVRIITSWTARRSQIVAVEQDRHWLRLHS